MGLGGRRRGGGDGGDWVAGVEEVAGVEQGGSGSGGQKGDRFGSDLICNMRETTSPDLICWHKFRVSTFTAKSKRHLLLNLFLEGIYC
jgi:hypothetical protein